uniref:Reverse transcriptase domain-containing protein n=1 Tax=Amphimedon queenslandica TaxID=400682 RepID=A0A1X7VWE2_AMPQE
MDPSISDIAHQVSLYHSLLCDPSDTLQFTVSKIEMTIFQLPKKKATGLDHISSEHLIYSASACAPVLCNLFNSILLTGSVPSSFCQSIIIPLFRGQGKVASDPSNYRARLGFLQRSEESSFTGTPIWNPLSSGITTSHHSFWSPRGSDKVLYSPILYSLFVNDLFLLEDLPGGLFIDSCYVGSPMYVDDICLISDNDSQLQSMLNVADSYANKWLYAFNPDKSVILVLGESPTSRQLSQQGRSFILPGKQLSEVDSAKHIAILLSNSASHINRATQVCTSFYSHPS